MSLITSVTSEAQAFSGSVMESEELYLFFIFPPKMKLARSMWLLIKKGNIFRTALGIFKNGAH